MNKQDFAVRIPSEFTLILSINRVLYGFCDAHGVTRAEVLLHFEEVRSAIEEGENFFDILWNDEGSQARLASEIELATDAIRFDFKGEE